MKLLLENWRKYLDEVKSFAKGATHANFISAKPKETLEVFRRMGADENMLSVIAEYTEQKTYDQASNQIIAVLAGAKPMWYGSMAKIANWREIDQKCLNSRFRSGEPVEILHEQECPDVEIGQFILSSLEKLGLTYEPVPVDQVVLGKPENVAAAAQEANRIGNPSNADARFHRVMGKALGYPEEDIEAFINDPAAKK